MNYLPIEQLSLNRTKAELKLLTTVADDDNSLLSIEPKRNWNLGCDKRKKKNARTLNRTKAELKREPTALPGYFINTLNRTKAELKRVKSLMLDDKTNLSIEPKRNWNPV